jgi:hypothetical protein
MNPGTYCQTARGRQSSAGNKIKVERRTGEGKMKMNSRASRADHRFTVRHLEAVEEPGTLDGGLEESWVAPGCAVECCRMLPLRWNAGTGRPELRQSSAYRVDVLGEIIIH